MNSELSALFDGELEPKEAQPLLERAASDPQLRDAWQTYALISDTLRRVYCGEADLTARIMARIHEEPVVLAPRRILHSGRHHPRLALAAALAGVAVVGWFALAESTKPGGSMTGIATVSPAPTLARLADPPQQNTQVAAKPTERRAEISEYLLAHHTQAASFRVGDSADHVRTISLSAKVERP